jgi:hypothetical protein
MNGLELEAVAKEISEAEVMATAVGVNNLPRVAAPIAKGFQKCWEVGNLQALNIITCVKI